MRSEKEIEQSLRQAELNVEVNAEKDRVVLDELAEVQGESGAAARAARRTMSRSAALRVAAIVAIAAATALLVSRHTQLEPGPRETGGRVVSTIELATAMSLEKAFRHGGIEAVESQYRRALGTTGKNPATPSVEELLTELETQIEDLRGEDL